MEEKSVHARPKARTEGIVVRELHEEVLIYDLTTHRAACLNGTAAKVWRLCDGLRGVKEIRRALEALSEGEAFESEGEASGLTMGSEGEVPEELVWLALDQLGRIGLLDARVSRPPELAGVSRRELIKRIGLGVAITLPAVASIVAPTPAQAASRLPPGSDCTDSGQCQSSICAEGKCL